jgi:SAM-dependent methyltransferase
MGILIVTIQGGVIEHFEEGPEKALKETRRVLKKGGILLATVPFLNAIRKLRFLFSSQRKTDNHIQKKVNRCVVEQTNEAPFYFCEYYFDAKALIPYFNRSGFSILEIIPTDFLWGDIAAKIRPLIKHGFSPDRARIIDFSTGSRTLKCNCHLRRALRDFFVTENRENIFSRITLNLLNYLSGHLILFVAKAE